MNQEIARNRYHDLCEMEQLRRKILNLYGLDVPDDGGIQQSMPECAQQAFSELLTLTKDYVQNDPLYFNSFESAFYEIIHTSYKFERNIAENEELITIEEAKHYLSKEQYQYIDIIYKILQNRFQYWLLYRDHYHTEGPAPTEVIQQIDKEIAMWESDPEYVNILNLTRNRRQRALSVKVIHDYDVRGIKKRWEDVKEKAAKAHRFYPYGELANRIMFISDMMLIYGIGDIRGVEDPENERLVKYLSVRPNFINDCWYDDYEEHGNFTHNYPIYFLPYIECESEAERIKNSNTDDEIFCEIMMFPAKVTSVLNPYGNLFTSVAQTIYLQLYQEDLLNEAQKWKLALEDAAQKMAAATGNHDQEDQIWSDLQSKIILPAAIRKQSLYETAMLEDYDAYKIVQQYTEHDPELFHLYCQAVFAEYSIRKIPLFLPDYSACATMYGKLLETCLKKRILPIFKKHCPTHRIKSKCVSEIKKNDQFTIGNAQAIISMHYSEKAVQQEHTSITSAELETWTTLGKLLKECVDIRNDSCHSGHSMAYEKVHRLLKKSAEVLRITSEICDLQKEHPV